MDVTEREWRINNLYSIVDKGGTNSTFQMNNIQEKLSRVKALRKMILKSRQVGISTYELISCADFTFFNENKTVCILAHEQDGIEKLFRIVRHAYDSMPEELKPQLDRGGGSKYELYFPQINSRIYCDLESRGDTIHKLHVSEVAFMKDLTRLKATLECVPFRTGQVTLETTPKGMNHFYQTWMDANTNYTKCFFPWFFHEEYRINNHGLTSKGLTKDEYEFISKAKAFYKVNITLEQIAFRRFKQADQKELFKQEYPEDDITCFLTSGNSPFNLEIIKPLYDEAKEPIEITSSGIRVYAPKESGELYIVAADTAEGIEGDYSVGHVFKVADREQVATFASNRHKPSEFAAILVEMANMYQTKSIPPLLCVERNNHGHAVLLYLDEVERYPNLFRHRLEDKKELERLRLGWITDKVTRPIMIDTFIEGVENGTVILRDKQTLAECLTLINNNGKIEADDGNHDDRVVAASIAVQMCIEESSLGIYANIGSAIKI